MKLKVTQKNVRLSGKKFEVGEVIEVEGDTVPASLVGKVAAVEQPRAAVTNPAENSIRELNDGYVSRSPAPGWFVVGKDGADLTKSLRADVIDEFDGLDLEGKAAFIETNKPAA